MSTADFHIEDARGGGALLKLTGDWTTMTLGRTAVRLGERLRGQTIKAVDLTELGRFDTAGALALVQASDLSMPADAFEGRPEAGRIYAMVETLERQSADPPKRPASLVRIFAKIGHGVHDAAAEFLLSMAFLGRLMGATGAAFRRPGAIRWPAWVSQADRAGLDALPIIAVTNFFIGAVIAFLGADLLTQFGAGVFAVELIGVSVLREFAVVITSVLLAGRSASSFAAEIGSMRMNQEVDAMQVMGVNPFQALVIPRLAALVLMLPLLTFVAMVAGLFGGMLVTWSQLALGPAFFLQRMVDTPDMFTHMLVGLSKAPVFAIVIAAIGCRQGLAVSGDVESLGRRVTAAVVQAIFAIIFLDAVFALVYLELDI
jgi:phospholipid/cholesterol/gamma-HCH transport system permease protein